MKEFHLVEAFLEMMSAERGAAKNTLSSYERDLTSYGEHLLDKGSRFTNAQVNQVETHLQNLSFEGLSASTQARHLSSIRQFISFFLQKASEPMIPAAPWTAPSLVVRFQKL